MQAEMEAVDELKERFLGEAKRGKQLRHPNLAEVIDFSVAADGTSYMVMEYIEGVNLRELMKRNNGPLDYRVLSPGSDSREPQAPAPQSEPGLCNRAHEAQQRSTRLQSPGSDCGAGACGSRLSPLEEIRAPRHRAGQHHADQRG